MHKPEEQVGPTEAWRQGSASGQSLKPFSVPVQQNALVFLGRRSRTKSDLSLKMYQEEIQVRAPLTLLLGQWSSPLLSGGSSPVPSFSC